MRAITFFLIMGSMFNCNGVEVEPGPLTLHFILTDENDQDLFFGQNAQYNPKDVKIVQEGDFNQDCGLYIPYDSTHFLFEGPLPIKAEFTFLLEFIPERIDTIYFSNIREKSEIFHKYILKYDAYFNGELICTDCSSKIYKIELK